MSDRGERIRRIGIYAGFLGAIAVACVFLSHWGIGIPCMFYQLTGWHCPGCGVSRMGLALLRGDFATAWYSNPALMLLLPCGIWMGLRLLCMYVQTGSRQLHGWENWLLYGVIGLLLVFGVIRNLPWYPYL